jgi:hypothetical protein
MRQVSSTRTLYKNLRHIDSPPQLSLGPLPTGDISDAPPTKGLQQALACLGIEQLITNTSEKFRNAAQTVAPRLCSWQPSSQQYARHAKEYGRAFLRQARP